MDRNAEDGSLGKGEGREVHERVAFEEETVMEMESEQGSKPAANANEARIPMR